MRFRWFQVPLLGLCLALGGATFAQDAAKSASSTPEAAAVKKLLEAKFPGAAISNVVKSPYFGLYEAQFDDQLVYTDAKVTYVMVGSVFNADTKENLTDARWRKLTRVSWDSLPFELAFKRVRGNGTRRMAIFADADCPFCKKLEADLRNLDDVTIYTFLYPIDSLHPDASRKSATLWCAEDRGKAWDAFFANGKLPNNSGNCPTPIAETAALGQRLRITAAPTLVFADGTTVAGAIPLARVQEEINKGEAEAKRLSATSK
ncbi:MAG TPA: DsbC family protein [Casimicrobiaceae bacterium]|nr:DsbC family protein [Casimicrobiaceae bacterium]